MKRIYKILSNFSNEDTFEGLLRLTNSEVEQYDSFENDPYSIFYMFDGKVCHWEKGHLMLGIIFGEDRLELFKFLDAKIHEGCDGYTIIEDITDEILHTMHDTSIYGFAEDNMKHDFHKYRETFLDKDDILDKICKHGIDSLTENDKLFLQDKKIKHPIDNI